MDPMLSGIYGSNNGISDQDLLEGHGFKSIDEPVTSEDSHEDCDFSDTVLGYINQILMEEDIDDKAFMPQESLKLQAAEKSFYDVIGQKYPPSPDQNGENSDEYACRNHSNCTSSSSNYSEYFVDPSPNFCNTYNYGYLQGGSESVWQFEKGVEEANKFLPRSNGVLINFEAPPHHELGVDDEIKRKFSHRDDDDLEDDRINKQAAVFPEPTLRSDLFDTVLLCSMGEGEVALEAYREFLRNGTDKKLLKARSKGPKIAKGGSKKLNRRKEVVDLRTLLMTCAQAVAADDRRTSNEILKQIRQHSSPFGDGNQRLAHCFADGLEARLAGTGSSIYKALVSKKTIASDYLKAYHLYLASCPFRKISHFVSNRTIMDNSVNLPSVHIIDFGILYGFQWPTLFQRVADRKGGPPRVRITGIEFPQPGFRPASGVEETGRRLADYARTFNVPFEYNAVAKNWDSIRLEDLKIDKNDYLVVTSLYRVQNLHDETVLKDSSRSIVLSLIRKINPDIFIHGILNGSYGAPFFVTRFREALFHFSALFDMLETNVPREHHERMLIERDIFGKEALNVIACEGWERIERPETYKQWQVRNLRAGFAQIPLSRELMNRAIEKVRRCYHKDFLIDEDSKWLIQGWKGRISYALSFWKPV